MITPLDPAIPWQIYWIGVHRNSSGAWTWSGGGYIRGPSDVSPFDIPPGFYPFDYPNPNDEADYGVMVGHSSFSYKIGDAPCFKLYRVFCQR